MTELDPSLDRQVKKLYQINIYMRWLTISFCWLTLGLFGLWGLRHEISLWFKYFTWSAVRYAIHFNPLPSLCLAFCIGITVSVLVWQSRNIIWGLPVPEKYRLQQKVKRIIAAGSSHPLWKFIHETK